MRNRFATVMLIVILSLCGITLLTGCQSTPQHTNVLIFGTNTKVAFDISPGATTTSPSITLGYARQEAVWMPLLANKNVDNPADCSNEHCLFKGKAGTNTDTYSVIASFGANFSGSGKTGEVKAEGGLAQYFATGLAARILAESGGDKIVSIQAADTKQSTYGPDGNSEKIRAWLKTDGNRAKLVEWLEKNSYPKDIATIINGHDYSDLRTKIISELQIT